MSYDQQIAFIIYIQNYSWPLPLMQLATAVGSVEFYLLFISAIYWCIDSRLGFRLGLILMLGQGLNDCLKIFFHTPRPYWVNRKVVIIEGSGSFGNPSGHSQNAVCARGYLAHFSKKAYAQATAFALIVVIGLSRIYLGAHFPIDVAAGWAVGALIIIVFILLEPRGTAFFQNIGLLKQILVSFLGSIGLLALFFLSLVSLGSWQVPQLWAENAMAVTGIPIDPFSYAGIFGSAGPLFGMGAGYSWLCQRDGFSSKGPAVLCLLRYFLGAAGLVLIRYVFIAIGLRQAMIIGYGIDYLSAVLASFWVAAGAPMLFIKAGPAGRKI